MVSKFLLSYRKTLRAGKLSRYSDWLGAGRSGTESRWGRDFPPVQTGPRAHPASCKMGTGSFPGVKSGRGVTLTPHSLLVPWSRKSRVIHLLPLWAVQPVQSFSACTRVHFTFNLTGKIWKGYAEWAATVIGCNSCPSLLRLLQPKDRGFVVRFPAGARDFLVSEVSTPTLGQTQRPLQPAPGIHSPGVKRPGREVDVFSPSRVEFQITWSHTSILPDCLRDVILN